MKLLLIILLGILFPCSVAAVPNPEVIKVPFSTSDEKVEIQKIVVKHSSILTDEQKNNLAQEWLGEYQLTELLSVGIEIANTITKIYHDQGYKTSWAVFPEQAQLEQGILMIEVIEGTVEKIQLEGIETLQKDYILSRIPAIHSQPFNTSHLYNDLQNLQRDPLIKNLQSRVEEGSEKQFTILTLNIIENPTQILSFQGNNNAPASTGAEEGFFTYGHKNLFGGGQEVLLQYNRSEGKDLGFASFTFPLTPQNTKLRLRGQIESNEIIIEPLSDFEFENDVTTYGVDLIHPVFENNRNSVIFTLSYDNHRSQSYILGERFEIDDRFPNGIAQYDVLRFSSQWVHRTETNVISLTPQLNFGLDRSFFYGRFFFDFLQSISEDLSVSFHFTAQVADEILLPQEQCKIGGSGSVNGAIRGYTRQAFRNDNCVAATLQASWSFFKSEDLGLKLKLNPFLQAGSVWKAQDSLIGEETLASTGVELELEWGIFFIKGYSAVPLVNVAEELEEPLGVTGGVRFPL